ncbi:unnamed protein product [Adineta ricciae]|uniref:Uncharacterized protein n=1 Tax=Adineta ricciae TaxID=249248 RepID=A0A815GX14_ADIRI|nr:unnamed protein product [Adineta ricciae]CAF1532946.1 unnamed protein product [Adineta ricciae]
MYGLNVRQRKCCSLVKKLGNFCGSVVVKNPSTLKNVTTTPIVDLPSSIYTNITEKPLSTSDIKQDESNEENSTEKTPSESPSDDKNEETDTPVVPKTHIGHLENERVILYVYGKYLTSDTKSNVVLITILTTTVIASVALVGFQACFLANVTVYDDGPCRTYGIMDCFYGSNHTYFQCTPDKSISLSYFKSATCFRWIGRLPDALGAVAQVFIRFLLFVFQQRLGVATGIHRVMEKTVGVYRVTRPCRCCGHRLCFHFGVLNLQLYERP